MGDRIGIQFHDDTTDETYILHSHWLGRSLLKAVQIWLREEEWDEIKGITAGQAIVGFIQWYTANYGLTDDLNIQTEDDDCEDNGVFVVDLNDGTVC